MKKYDFDKAKRIILERKDRVSVASLGMLEDWFWTATPIFEDCEFCIPENYLIAGINGSIWATPFLKIEYRDSSETFIPCYIGESEENASPSFSFGELSGPCQEIINEKSKKNWEDI